MIYKKHYSPGPSAIRENVRLARAYDVTNPDTDVDFVYYYKETCDLYNKIIDSNNATYILSGEAILGLEAACASLTEFGDRVLVIDNGIYGNGFKDFVTMYGGKPTLLTTNYKEGISEKELEDFLNKDSNFKYATIVHCDTPTGVINDVHKLCPILKKHGILSVIDSVSGMVGEYLSVNKSKADIVIGGSQKAISAQAGLTLVTVSEDAKKTFSNRKSNIIGFYNNLTIWENYLEEQYFPYTLPASDIVSLRVALENILEEGCNKVIERHNKIATALRKAISNFGLKLYLDKDFSNTVTAIDLQGSYCAMEISKYIEKNYNLILATSLGQFKDKIIRIGHMGENAYKEKVVNILNLLDDAFNFVGHKSETTLLSEFILNYED